MALRSDEIAGVAGFLAPGSRVDVLVTYHDERSSQPVTATVLVDVRVLAAGQQVKPDPTGKPATATVVTLLLDPMEAERAVLASAQGSVHFVLRNNLDPGKIMSAPVSAANLNGPSFAASSNPHPLLPGFDPFHSLSKSPQQQLPPAARIQTVYGDGTGNAAAAKAEQP